MAPLANTCPFKASVDGRWIMFLVVLSLGFVFASFSCKDDDIVQIQFIYFFSLGVLLLFKSLKQKFRQ